MAGFVDRMMGAARLDVATYEEVEADAGATGQAMGVVVLAALAAGVGAWRDLGLLGMGVAAVAALIAWFVWALLTYVIGTRLLPEQQTQADLGQLLRTIGFSSSPGLLRVAGIVPIVGWLISFLAGVWMLVAMVIAVRQALDYNSTGRAVIVCLIGFIFYVGLQIAVGLALLMTGLAGAGVR